MKKKNPRRAAAAERVVANSFNVHMTDREGWYVIVHARSGAFVLDGHDDQALMLRMFEDMDLLDTYNLLVGGVGAAELERMSSDPTKFEVYELSSAALNFFLDKFTKGKMLPDVALQLAPVVKRFKDAKVGDYEIPEADPKAPPATPA